MLMEFQGAGAQRPISRSQAAPAIDAEAGTASAGTGAV